MSELENKFDELLQKENNTLRLGLDAAIRAATLAVFVIEKTSSMPNDSWRAGFERDLGQAKAARAGYESELAALRADVERLTKEVLQLHEELSHEQ